MSAIDIAIIIIYLLGIVAFGLWSVRKDKASTDSYFLAGHSLKWPVIGAALFATNISSIHLVGLAEAGFQTGLNVGNYEWISAAVLLILGLVFAPFYFRSKIATLPEYLEKRYNKGSRTILAVTAVITALLIHIGLSLYASAILFESFFNIPFWVSIISISILTCIYTIVGGLKAVVITETIQTFLLLSGALILAVISVKVLNGEGIHSWEELKSRTKPGQLSMIHDLYVVGEDGSKKLNGESWLAFFICFPILSIWYWCTDQTIVQRVLGAKTEKDARLGPLFASFLKLSPVFLLIIPGITAYVVFGNNIEAKNALPEMIMKFMPVGIRGLFVAGLLAALMSTIAGALNSTSTLIALDIAPSINKDLSESQKIKIGRISAGTVMILAMLASSQGGQFGSIFDIINKIPVSFAPSITCVFLFGVFWKRGSSSAGFYTLLSGLVLGLLYFILDLKQCGSIFTEKLGIPFLIMGAVLFVIASIIYISISYCTERPNHENLKNLTWDSPLQILFNADKTNRLVVVTALGLFSTIVVLYVLIK